MQKEKLKTLESTWMIHHVPTLTIFRKVQPYNQENDPTLSIAVKINSNHAFKAINH